MRGDQNARQETPGEQPAVGKMNQERRRFADEPFYTEDPKHNFSFPVFIPAANHRHGDTRQGIVLVCAGGCRRAANEPLIDGRLRGGARRTLKDEQGASRRIVPIYPPEWPGARAVIG
ncbi:MAG: hypothetical protein Fur0039_23660 [Rhodocyclaceae bacterium]